MTTAEAQVSPDTSPSPPTDGQPHHHIVEGNGGLPGRKRPNPSAASSTEDEAEKLAARREANRIHAFKSRQRSKALLQELQRTVELLSGEKSELERENAVLRAQVDVLQQQNLALTQSQRMLLIRAGTAAVPPAATTAASGTGVQQTAAAAATLGLMSQAPATFVQATAPSPGFVQTQTPDQLVAHQHQHPQAEHQQVAAPQPSPADAQLSQQQQQQHQQQTQQQAQSSPELQAQAPVAADHEQVPTMAPGVADPMLQYAAAAAVPQPAGQPQTAAAAQAAMQQQLAFLQQQQQLQLQQQFQQQLQQQQPSKVGDGTVAGAPSHLTEVALAASGLEASNLPVEQRAD